MQHWRRQTSGCCSSMIWMIPKEQPNVPTPPEEGQAVPQLVVVLVLMVVVLVLVSRTRTSLQLVDGRWN